VADHPGASAGPKPQGSHRTASAPGGVSRQGFGDVSLCWARTRAGRQVESNGIESYNYLELPGPGRVLWLGADLPRRGRLIGGSPHNCQNLIAAKVINKGGRRLCGGPDAVCSCKLYLCAQCGAGVLLFPFAMVAADYFRDVAWLAKALLSLGVAACLPSKGSVWSVWVCCELTASRFASFRIRV
jgi:hypothetical protein